MTYDDVDREARHDWLDQLADLRADARPDPSEYEDLGAPAPSAGRERAGALSPATPRRPAANPKEGSRAEWHQWRRGGLGASDIAGVVGLSRWSTPWTVFAAKAGLGVRDDDRSDDRLEFGQRAERFLAEWFTDVTGLHVAGEQAWCTSPERPWMRATVDGFVVESQNSEISQALGVWECKTAADRTWTEIPLDYQCQIQWSLAVTGLARAWVPVLHLAGGHPRFVVYELERNETDIETLVTRGERFWHDCVLAGVAPPTDGTPMTAEALAAAWRPEGNDVVELGADVAEAVVDLRRRKAALRALEATIRADENEIKAALGEATEGFVDGELAVSWRSQSRRGIDTKGLRADHPELADKYETLSDHRVLRLHEPRRSA